MSAFWRLCRAFRLEGFRHGKFALSTFPEQVIVVEQPQSLFPVITYFIAVINFNFSIHTRLNFFPVWEIMTKKKHSLSCF